MRRFRTLLLVGSGIAAIAAGTAFAGEHLHHMTVRLPDGSLEQISYIGNQPPQVRFEGAGDTAMMPVFDPVFGPAPFADLERISAAMERQQAELFRIADAEMAAPDFGNLPAGTQGYSMVSVMSGGKACTTSIRYFSGGNGKPQVEKGSSGNCDGAARPAATTVRAPKPQQSFVAPRFGNVIDAAYKARSPAKPVELAGLY